MCVDLMFECLVAACGHIAAPAPEFCWRQLLICAFEGSSQVEGEFEVPVSGGRPDRLQLNYNKSVMAVFTETLQASET